jgi:hypothetical protein
VSKPVEERLKERIDAVEASYEYMLAFAAQGATGEEEAGPATEIRSQLKHTETALEELAGLVREVVTTKGLEPAQVYRAFVDVLDRDANIALAAIQLVLAQRAISSQLIDNLNALIHLRSLITDLFLIDEILKSQ